jgi:hypothetical protein
LGWMHLCHLWDVRVENVQIGQFVIAGYEPWGTLARVWVVPRYLAGKRFPVWACRGTLAWRDKWVRVGPNDTVAKP